MSRPLRTAEALRLYLLPLTVPYAILWAGIPGSGAWIMVITHALLVLLYAQSLDAACRSADLEPRLALTPDRHAFIGHAASIGRFLTIDVLIVFILVLLIIEPMLGVSAAMAMLAILVFIRNLNPRQRWFMLAELWWAVLVMLVPLVLVMVRSANGADGSRIVVPPGTVAATLLGAAMLAAYIGLCLIRDEPLDRGAGLRTTATVLGRAGAVAGVFLSLFLAIGVAAWGSSRGWWWWGAAAVGGWSALVAVYLLAIGHERRAVRLWWLGASVTAVLIVATSPPPIRITRAPPVSPEAQSELIHESAQEVAP